MIEKGDVEITYTYDDLGQLTQESNGTTVRTYTYDKAGNIVSIKSEPVSTDDDGLIIRAARALPSILPLEKILTYTDSEWGDKLTSFAGHTIVYDAIGNPISYYNGTAYTFDWTGRQLTTAVKGSTNMSFTYDDNGIRTSKTVNGVKHTYKLNGSQIVSEEWEDNLLIYLYDSTGMPIGMMYRTTSYTVDQWDIFWFEKNLQGDIVAVYNESGTKVATYTYSDAWGNHTASYTNGGGSTGAQYNPFRYRGYYYDTDLGMYYLQSRYYDPNTCRFINADGYVSTGQGLIGYNMFAYCGNNPVMRVDPTGRIAISTFLGSYLILCAAFLLLSITNSEVASEKTTFAPINSTFSDKRVYANETNNEEIFAAYTVYGLKNRETETIEYVGRTKNVDARKIAHANSSNRGHLEFVVLEDNLSYIQARGIEQYYMLVYHTLNPEDPQNNQINGISIKNPNLNVYKNSVLDYFENQLSNEFLNWLGV